MGPHWCWRRCRCGRTASAGPAERPSPLAAPLATRARQVIGLEIIEPAVADALENARINEITNANFYAGDARLAAVVAIAVVALMLVLARPLLLSSLAPAIAHAQGVAVRAGTHCAMPLLERFGATSTCRASFGLYNTMQEVDKLADALQKAEALFA